MEEACREQGAVVVESYMLACTPLHKRGWFMLSLSMESIELLSLCVHACQVDHRLRWCDLFINMTANPWQEAPATPRDGEDVSERLCAVTIDHTACSSVRLQLCSSPLSHMLGMNSLQETRAFK